MLLRDYQQECVDAILRTFKTQDSTLAVAATGLGKTVVFASVIGLWEQGRVLVVAHRDELIQQAKATIEWICGEQVAIEMGAERSHEKSALYKQRIVATSVQTMSRERRHSRFDPSEFGLVIFDEAHHATANTYLKVLGHFRQNQELKWLGVTATPDRADKEALGKVFQSVCFEYGIKDGVRDGWLVPIEQRLVWVEGLDFSKCRTTLGDLNQGQLAGIMEQEKMLHGVVSPTIQIAGDRKTLIFTTSVAQAERCCEIANRHRPESAEWVSGDTPMDERRELLRRYAKGDFQFLFNCAITLEGFDEPGISVVAMARPTKSRSLYTQAIGRGTRPLKGVVDGADESGRHAAIAASDKPGLLVLDFVGNSGRHKLVHATDVLGEEYDQAVLDEAIKSIGKKSTKGLAANVTQELEDARERLEELKRRADEKARQASEAYQAWLKSTADRQARAGITPEARYGSRKIGVFDSFDITPGICLVDGVKYRPTAAQVAFLQQSKVSAADIAQMTAGDAGRICGEINRRRKLHLATLPQINLLARYRVDAKYMTKNQATAEISKIAAREGWKSNDTTQKAPPKPTPPPPPPKPLKQQAMTWD